MANRKIDLRFPTEVIQIRLTRPDFERLRDVALAEERPVRSQARLFLRRGMDSAVSLRADPLPPGDKAPK